MEQIAKTISLTKFCAAGHTLEEFFDATDEQIAQWMEEFAGPDITITISETEPAPYVPTFLAN